MILFKVLILFGLAVILRMQIMYNLWSFENILLIV